MNIYTVALATRLKRRVFAAGGIPPFFEKNITVVFSGNGITLKSIRFLDYGVVMEIGSDEELERGRISNLIRRGTSSLIRNEFSELMALPSLWTRQIYFEKGCLDDEKEACIKAFYDSLRTR